MRHARARYASIPGMTAKSALCGIRRVAARLWRRPFALIPAECGDHMRRLVAERDGAGHCDDREGP